MRAVVTAERIPAIQQLVASLVTGASRPLKSFQRMLGLMASASPVLKLHLLQMLHLQRWLKHRVPSDAWCHGRLRIKVNRACVTALGPWKCHQWMEQGVPLEMVCRRKVVSTDASNMGWGALCEGRPAFRLWSKEERSAHINCLEMLTVCQALHAFLPDLKWQHILVRSDSMTVVAYINHQGGLSSRHLFTLMERLLEWAQHDRHSLRATHVPGLNQGADMLSRSNVSSEKWTHHPQMVQEIWEIFGRSLVEVDLFASKDNSHCLTYYSKNMNALAQPPPLCVSPNCSDPSGHQANQETQSYFSGPALREPVLVLKAVSAAHRSPLAHSPEMGPPLSGEQNNVASPGRAVSSAPLASQWALADLPESVQNLVICFWKGPGGWTPLAPSQSVLGICKLFWGLWRALPLSRYSLSAYNPCC